MLWEKTRNFFSFLIKADSNKKAQFLYLVVFVFLFLLTRLPGLKIDVINPDGVNWHFRSEQFIVGIKYHQFEKTFQHYQPGVSLMWLSGVAIELYKQFTGITTYTTSNFENFDLVAKLSVVFAQLVLSIIIIYVFSSEVGFTRSIITTSLFTFEPFFIGNSRLYHLDALFTLLVLLGILFAYTGLKRNKILYPMLAGLFISLTFLTKSIGIGAVLFVLFYSLAYFLSVKQLKRFFKYSGVFLLSFLIFTFVLFPALWVDPVYYLSFIFSNALNVGFVRGHGQIIMGEYTRNAGFTFYPLVLLVKSSPFILCGFILGVIQAVKKIKVNFSSYKQKFLNINSYLIIFYLGYLALMSIPAKKVDRYAIIAYPMLATFAYFGYFSFLSKVKNKKLTWVGIIVLVFAFWFVPLVQIYPYYFTYTNPAFGSTANSNSIIAQKPFGVGMDLLKKHIVSVYGSDSTLGFYDTQPIKAIYANSKVFDVNVYGPGSYNLLVLGINEQIPEKVLSSIQFKFEKESSIWINGLEYWRIYAKKAR